MNIKFVCYITVCFFLLCQTSFAQSPVTVSPLTGSANIVIPIYTVSNGQVAVPISISYNSNGVKTKDVEGTAGMNWQLNTGGQVTRVVRGLPDDCTLDNTSQSRVGWMSSTNSGATYGSSNFITNNGTTCSNGVTDITNINNNIPYTMDTEPDVFYVNAPGLSCQLVYDRVSARFRPVNYQDLIITYTTNGPLGTIGSFTITNDKGVKYLFNFAETVTENTSLTSSSGGTGTGQYLNTKYNQYKNGITYADSWSLGSITDINGNSIVLDYVTATPRNSVDPVSLFLAGSTTQTVQYYDNQTTTPQVIQSIGTANNANLSNLFFEFTWNSQAEIVQTGQTLITSITGMGRSMLFAYGLVSFTTGGYQRAFLTNFSDAGCGTPINYQFAYIGVNTAAGTTTLADSTSKQMDYWGYYSSSASTSTLQPSVYVNPSTGTYPRYAINTTTSPGSAYAYSLAATLNRSVTASSITAGALNTVTYGTGGTTTITYEPNDYYDVPSGTTIQGGGIRVKQITDSQGSGSTNNIVRNYSYVNPAGTTNAGLSSGEPVTLPQFAFTIPYNGTATGQSLWTNATALSAYDLSVEDHTVMYSYTTESQTGAGSTLYSFSNPATYWNTSAAPSCNGCTTEWYPTINYAATYSCPPTSGPIANLVYSFPFAPNPNYDFERGLPIKVTAYNDAGNEVSEINYTYQRSFTPTAIIAFKAEDVSNTTQAKFYSQYKVYYNTSELTATVNKKIYDSNNAGQVQSTTTNYAYNSAYHKLLTQQTATNSDNSTINTYYSYVKDFAPNASATNSNINALYNLQQLNVNAPVETYQTVTRPSGTVTTSASLTLYAPSVNGSITNYLPVQQQHVSSPYGQATFTPFSINTSAQTVTADPNYMPVANFDQYDNGGYLETADDTHKNVQTSFFDYLTLHTTAIFKNAYYNQVAFNDFDSMLAPSVNTFTISGTGSYTPVGSHAGKAAGIATTQTVTSATISKNPTAQNYIFSIWINPSAAGTLTITGASTNYTINYTALAWTYYEIKIPASALSSTFALSLTASTNVSIDDILLYPDVSEASTATYDATGHFKIAETNTNGVSAYYNNDQWGRVLLAYDQDKNIVARKQYLGAVTYQNFLTPTILPPKNSYTGLTQNYTNTSPNTCLTDGVTYTWNFGDGTTPYTTSSYAPQPHAYATAGQYTITVTATSPIFGTKTGTLIFNVVNFPNVKISYTNFCTPGGKIPSAIATVNFMQGGVTVYSYNNAQLVAGATVPPGNYTIQIIPIGTQYNSVTNPTGYGAVLYQGTILQCWNFTGSSFSVTDNISYTPTIYLSIQPGSCNP